MFGSFALPTWQSLATITRRVWDWARRQDTFWHQREHFGEAYKSTAVAEAEGVGIGVTALACWPPLQTFPNVPVNRNPTIPTLVEQVSRERAPEQEDDLGEALAGFEADTTSREGFGKVVFQLGHHIFGFTWVEGAPGQREKLTHAALALTACRCEVVTVMSSK